MERQEIAGSLLTRLAGESNVAEKIGSVLSDGKSEDVRNLVLSSLSNSADLPMHSSWIDSIRQQLGSADETKIESAINVIAATKSDSFRSELESIGASKNHSARIRLRAMQAAKGSLDRPPTKCSSWRWRFLLTKRTRAMQWHWLVPCGRCGLMTGN